MSRREERRKRRAAAAGAGLSLGAALGMGATAQAADIIVDDPGDSGAGTLRDAVDQANLDPASDRILFESSITGITLTTGELDVYYPLQIVGPGPGALTISGNDNSRILDLEPTPPVMNVTVSGVTLAAGYVLDEYGGAVYSEYTNLTVSNSVITASEAAGTAGNEGLGGGIAAYYGSINLVGSTVSGNEATGDDPSGGGIYADSVDSLRINGSVISGNTGAGDTVAGGGIFAAGSPGPPTTVDISDSRISDNHAIGTGADVAGGLFVGGAGSVNVDRSTISGNSTATGPGGGAYLVASPATVRNSTISGNQAYSSGGGLYAFLGPATIQRSTISGNTAGFQGGGIATALNVAELTDSTVARNTATGVGFPGSYGGGVFLCACSSATISNSILADNSAGDGADLEVSGGPDPDAAFSLIEAPVGGGAVNETVPGSNRLGVDPQLGGLADNGGPTQTMALPATSPALNKGSSFSRADQRGVTRPVAYPGVPFSTATGANGADMGAFELQAPQAPQAPSNKFDFGNLKRNVKKGTAFLIVFVPGPGEIGLQGKGVAGVPLSAATTSRSVPASGIVKLKIKAGKGKAGRKIRRALLGKGTASFTVKVTYVPTGGTSNTRTRKIKLVKHQR